MPELSICIPTYNRSACLAELLDSIVRQGVRDVEVVIGDDASPDDTAQVVETFRAALPNLKYFRHPANVGLDDNFLATVAAASGDYIWLMGDDDRLEPGGLARVAAALETWPGVVGLTLGVIDYDPDMRSAVGVRGTPATQLLHGAAEVFGTIAEHLGFMSALVIDRRKWMAVCASDPIDEFKKYYVQVYILGRALGETGAWGIVNEACVGFRTSNDQFLSKLGWLKRMQVDVIAYEQLAAALLPGDPAARRRMRRRIFRAHVLARIRMAKTQPGRTPQIGAAIRFLAAHYADLPDFWTQALVTLALPGALVRAARAAYQRFGPSSGASRARRLSVERS